MGVYTVVCEEGLDSQDAWPGGETFCHRREGKENKFWRGGIDRMSLGVSYSWPSQTTEEKNSLVLLLRTSS